MTDITYTHETPSDAAPEAGFPESTLSLRLDVDGVGISWTLRGSDESMSKRLPRVLDYLKRLQATLPKPETAPQAPLEEREDYCAIHGTGMVKQSNDRGRWYSHKTPEGTWCKGTRRKAGA